MIHILFAGLALCGAGMPNDWAEGDRWVGVTDLENLKNATCPGCLAAHRERFPKVERAVKPEAT